MAAADSARTVLVTGAAGSLGGMLARHLLPSGLPLRLTWHRRPLAPALLLPTLVHPTLESGRKAL